MMKLAPPILILSTTTAFIPPARQGIHYGKLYEQSPLQGVDLDSTDNTPLPGVEDEHAFNIGEMPRSLDESVRKKQIAKVRLKCTVMSICPKSHRSDIYKLVKNNKTRTHYKNYWNVNNETFNKRST